MTASDEDRLVLKQFIKLLELANEKDRALSDIPYLISKMSAVDQRKGTRFSFEHIRDPLEPGEVEMVGNKLVARDKNWRWQRFVVDRLLKDRRLIFLKGRQIGVTWITIAVDVAEAIVLPGTASLVYRQRHDEAVDNVRRWWTLFESLPKHLTEHINVIKPDRAERPGMDGVALQFPDLPGKPISEIIPMSSAAASGHGRTIRRGLLDEAAHIEKLAAIRAALEPAAGDAAIAQVSTANGRSNPETGEGNEFHRLWTNPGGYKRIFLPYDLHPERDQKWYDTAPEVQSLRIYQRQEQFPRDEHEAFALSDRSFFDPDALLEYADRVQSELRRFDFEPVGASSAKVVEHDNGRIRTYREPDAGGSYAVGADVATGRGADYSAAFVVDLSSMELVAEYHGKVEADVYARDLHYLGRRYNTALIAVETSGGFGEAVIVQMKDGVTGRPPYPRLYRHVLSSRPDRPISKPYGFPTNTKTRPLILNQLEQAIREKSLPWVGNDLLHEMTEFVHHDTGTSPRARDGSRDDRVMACAISLEMYRLYGKHPEKTTAPRGKRGGITGLGRKKQRVSTIDMRRYAA